MLDIRPRIRDCSDLDRASQAAGYFLRRNSLDSGYEMTYADIDDIVDLRAALNSKADLTPLADEILSGCGVAWSGSGLIFNVSAGSVRINGTIYTIAAGTVTLSAADPSNTRIDVIVATTSGTADKVTGTPAPGAVEPDVDSSTQIRLAAVTIAAGATVPADVSGTPIFTEGVEWSISDLSASFVADATASPHSGTKHVRGTNVTPSQRIRFTNSISFDPSNDGILIFWVKPNTWHQTNGRLRVQWRNTGGTGIGSALLVQYGTFGFVPSVNAYQQIVIPMSAFAITAGATVKTLEFSSASASATNISFDLDDVTLQDGVETPPAGHTHPISDIINLQSTLTSLQTQIDGKAALSHTHTIGNVTGLQTALDGKAALSHSHVIADTTGLQTALDAKADLVGGKVPSSQLPSIAISDFLGSVANEAAMLALDGERGDWAIRTDESTTYILIDDDPSDIDSWQAIATPTDLVLSVNGETGAVVLGYADVGAAAATHSHAISDVTGLQTALDGKQPIDTLLTNIGNLSMIADRIIYGTGSDTVDLATITTFGRSLIDDADNTAARSTLGLVIGTNVQAYNANLASIAGLTIAADTLIYGTGSATFGTATVTSAARSVLDDSTVAAMRATMEVDHEKVVTLSDGATPALDASAGNSFVLTAAGNRTIAVPSNPTDGQKITIRHIASGGARTLALNSGTGGFLFGTDITALSATSSGKMDIIGCIYDVTLNKWCVVSYVKGF